MKRILVIDIGGSNIKLRATGRKDPVKIPSGGHMTPRAFVNAVRKATSGWRYDCISIGYPGLVVDGVPKEDNPHLERGWTRFELRRAFGRPMPLCRRWAAIKEDECCFWDWGPA